MDQQAKKHLQEEFDAALEEKDQHISVLQTQVQSKESVRDCRRDRCWGSVGQPRGAMFLWGFLFLFFKKDIVKMCCFPSVNFKSHLKFLILIFF